MQTSSTLLGTLLVYTFLLLNTIFSYEWIIIILDITLIFSIICSVFPLLFISENNIMYIKYGAIISTLLLIVSLFLLIIFLFSFMGVRF